MVTVEQMTPERLAAFANRNGLTIYEAHGALLGMDPDLRAKIAESEKRHALYSTAEESRQLADESFSHAKNARLLKESMERGPEHHQKYVRANSHFLTFGHSKGHGCTSLCEGKS